MPVPALALPSLLALQAPSYPLPAQGVEAALLRSDAGVTVLESPEAWTFTPTQSTGSTTLLFFPGSGVEPKAYAPLLRPLAAQGWTILLVKVPPLGLPPEPHKQAALALGRKAMAAHPGPRRWVVAGHSMGGAIAARFVHEEPARFHGMVLVGTTHPRDFDLSAFPGVAVKVYGTADGVARQAQSEANRSLMPKASIWVGIEGGNHAQFGDYGPQPGDGKATLPRVEQQARTRSALHEVLQRVQAAQD